MDMDASLGGKSSLNLNSHLPPNPGSRLRIIEQRLSVDAGATLGARTDPLVEGSRRG